MRYSRLASGRDPPLQTFTAKAAAEQTCTVPREIQPRHRRGFDDPARIFGGQTPQAKTLLSRGRQPPTISRKSRLLHSVSEVLKEFAVTNRKFKGMQLEFIKVTWRKR